MINLVHELDGDQPLEYDDLCELAISLIDIGRISQERLKARRVLTKLLKRLQSEYKIVKIDKEGLHLYPAGWVKLGSETYVAKGLKEVFNEVSPTGDILDAIDSSGGLYEHPS
ncbi:MAG: hypothetical protein KAS32_09205 [Candidatus Peribacteraceae bacterium]|nr:hypothetical protein [Candidatus Peribacteraceae bacterium]